MFLDLANISPALQSQRMLVIDPLPCHLTVATWLHCRPFFTRVDERIPGPQDPWCFIIDFLSFPLFLCTVESCTLSSASVTNVVLFSST